jgi:hypothetical protein
MLEIRMQDVRNIPLKNEILCYLMVRNEEDEDERFTIMRNADNSSFTV